MKNPNDKWAADAVVKVIAVAEVRHLVSLLPKQEPDRREVACREVRSLGGKAIDLGSSGLLVFIDGESLDFANVFALEHWIGQRRGRGAT